MKTWVILFFAFILNTTAIAKFKIINAGFGAGAALYNGDLTKTISLKLIRPSANIAIEYQFHPRISIKSTFTYAALIGDDAISGDKFRNLRFQTNIFELNCTPKIYLKKINPCKLFSHSMYAYAGLGVFHFNPYTYMFTNIKVDLMPLGTEGQGNALVSPYKEKYKLTAVCIPFGGGWQFFFNRKWIVGAELGLRYSFTDYIDDVSGYYVATNLLQKGNSNISAILSDQSANQYLSTQAESPRGNPTLNDMYLIGNVYVCYIFKSECVALKGNKKGVKKKANHIYF
jgi:hypothetical protein